MLLNYCILLYTRYNIVEGGYVYVKINKAWFGLRQSCKIPHNDFVQHLNKQGYVQAKNSDRLFFHGLCDISFTLVVDDFGIQYTNKDDVNHLISLMQGMCKFKVDFDTKQYIEIHLKWNDLEQTIRYAMKGYVEQAQENQNISSPANITRATQILSNRKSISL